MEYKGFIVKHYYDVRSGVFIGEVINAPQAIIFSAITFDSLKTVMRDAIDNYVSSILSKEMETSI
jgi:predicted HicB family RNase H-like nuclease